MSLASPAEVLDALRKYLLPTPLYHQLPTMLRLYAHMTLLSNTIGEQAAIALAVHAKTRRKESQLSAEEFAIIEGCTTRARTRTIDMRRLSLDLRRAHLQTIIQAPITEWYADLMLKSYFPAEISSSHEMLFITSLDPEADIAEIRTIADHRRELQEWLALAREEQSQGREWPAAPKGPRVGDITPLLLPLAEQCVADAEALMGVFGASRRRSMPQMTAEKAVKRARASEPARM